MSYIKCAIDCVHSFQKREISINVIDNVPLFNYLYCNRSRFSVYSSQFNYNSRHYNSKLKLAVI